MNWLVYLSYGSGPHIQETIFSLLSTLRHGGVDPSYHILIVTDDPEPYQGLQAEFETLSSTQISEWRGPANFAHRIKVKTVQHLLKSRGGKVVLVDGDTYFLKSPAQLFDRVAPGRAVMHLREGRVGYLVALGQNRVRLSEMSLDLGALGRYEFDSNTVMWNSGVVGLDAADAARVDEALVLTDAIHAAVPTHLSEQLAFSRVLERHNNPSSTRDIVFHYHQAFLRTPFRKMLPERLDQTADLPPAERAAALYPSRPVAAAGKTIKAVFKRKLKLLGFFRYDLETSI